MEAQCRICQQSVAEGHEDSIEREGERCPSCGLLVRNPKGKRYRRRATMERRRARAIAEILDEVAEETNNDPEVLAAVHARLMGEEPEEERDATLQ